MFMKIDKKTKPNLSLLQLWNMSFGFFGIQFGFALQTGNASRILQTFGANIEHLSLFWLAAPLGGMLIQPLIGYYSDRTWTRLGRRRPYFLVGAVFASLAIVLMPNASLFVQFFPPLLIGAGLLLMMDISINVAMEPFRALVADNLPSSQHTTGFSIQTFLIGLGAVLGSFLPYILAEYFDVAKTAAIGTVPDNVVYSFYVGAFLLLSTILWTICTTKEYTPHEREQFVEIDSELPKHESVLRILSDFIRMPKAMLQLGVVQFFSWFALFSMWVFATPAIAEHIYNLPANDTSSETYANAGNWVGILFGVYNGIAACYALIIPKIAQLTNIKIAHAISLCAGGIGLVSIFFIQSPLLLIYSMIGVGIAWGSILATPYAILASLIPANKMGVYMGIFNFFITLPQLINGFLGGYILKSLFNGKAIYAIVMAGILFFISAISVFFVNDEQQNHKSANVK